MVIRIERDGLFARIDDSVTFACTVAIALSKLLYNIHRCLKQDRTRADSPTAVLQQNRQTDA